jgi:hypothetical protein
MSKTSGDPEDDDQRLGPAKLINIAQPRDGPQVPARMVTWRNQGFDLDVAAYTPDSACFLPPTLHAEFRTFDGNEPHLWRVFSLLLQFDASLCTGLCWRALGFANLPPGSSPARATLFDSSRPVAAGVGLSTGVKAFFETRSWPDICSSLADKGTFRYSTGHP